MTQYEHGAEGFPVHCLNVGREAQNKTGETASKRVFVVGKFTSSTPVFLCAYMRSHDMLSPPIHRPRVCT